MAAYDAVVRRLDAPATAAVGMVLGGLAHLGGWPLAEAPGPGVHGYVRSERGLGRHERTWA